MNVLIVHNAYQYRGGEDSVVEAEIELLRLRGHVVEVYRRDNADIAEMSRITVATQTFWSTRTVNDINTKVSEFKPDIIHAHNTFPLISPSLYWAAEKANIPVVQTLHNFRLLCPQAMFLRKGNVCEDCLGHIPWRGGIRGCYRDSKVQSTVLACMVTLHRTLGTWKDKVTRYIALNEFCRNKFVEGGLPAHRIVVKPNFVDFNPPTNHCRDGFLFVGRLSAEKGIAVLASASKRVEDVVFRVAGMGPERALLEGMTNVKLLGGLDGEAVRREMSSALALVLPSIWYENFPRTLVEAYGCGLPVIASRIGALMELVQDGTTGLLFEPGNAADLAAKITWAKNNPEEMLRMGRNAREFYESNLIAQKNYEQLIAIYQDAIKEVNQGLIK